MGSFVVLVVLILAGLAVIAVGLATGPARRRNVRAARLEQRAAEAGPIPGLALVAQQEGWQGPLTDPLLTPGAPGILPPGYSPASQPLAGGMASRTAEPVRLEGYAGNLTMHLHEGLKSSSSLSAWTADLSIHSDPDAYPGQRPRLVSCYRARVGDSDLVIGNCYLVLEGPTTDPGGDQLPDLLNVGSAFCAASLPGAFVASVQVLPRVRSLLGSGGDRSGFAALDERYRTVTTTGGRMGARMVRALGGVWPAPIGPRLAAFIASRDDWAFTIRPGLLACATLEPLRDGEQARQLVSATAEAVALIGK